MGSGLLSSKAFAFYDQSLSSWRTSPHFAAADSAEYSATWPRSGMTRTGQAFELQTSAPPIAESGSSSSHIGQRLEPSLNLLPTPNTGDTTSGQPVEVRRARHHQVRLADVFVTAPPPPQPIDNQADSHTPSPGCCRSQTVVRQSRRGAQRPRRGARDETSAAVANVTGERGEQGLAEATRQSQGSDADFDGHQAVAEQRRNDAARDAAFDWQQYEPAIRRWETVMGRPAPAPIERGTRGQPRLSARLVEWLMGLSAGYVTDLGLPRSAELRALGNGVVLQQAERALKELCRIVSRD